uniref:Uncharacterized protein n=1 Tax=Rhizophora mucronata TaxID=61149 RepID=A0A2P2N6D9_RHIMU
MIENCLKNLEWVIRTKSMPSTRGSHTVGVEESQCIWSYLFL